MRIRQVKPAFWSDACVAALPPAARLFYIGLWMEADDAGWLRWDAAQVANELYGYEPRARRERNTLEFLAQLHEAERIVAFPCGHVFIPTLVLHQKQAASTRQVRTVQKEHESCGDPQPSADIRNTPLPSGPVSKGKRSVKGQGTERSVKVKGQVSAPANTPDGAGAAYEPGVPDFLRVVQ